MIGILGRKLILEIKVKEKKKTKQRKVSTTSPNVLGDWNRIAIGIFPIYVCAFSSCFNN